jgi:hypothetical protein
MSSSPSPAPELTVGRSLTGRVVGGFGTSILGGALLGAASWVSDELDYPLGLLLPVNLIGAWLAVAFVLGTTARTVPTGALRGLIGLLAAVAAYYLLIAAFGEGFRAIGASHAAVVWGVVALVAGPVLGAAGGVWRHGAGWPRAIAVALLAAALIGEGVVFGAGRWLAQVNLPSDPGALILVAEVVIGLALPWLLLRQEERVRGYLATAAFAVGAALLIQPVTTIIRGIADTF